MKWLVWRQDDEDCEARVDGSVHVADSEEDAAEAWAWEQDWQSAGFAIVGGRDEPEVLVAPVDDDNAEPVLLRVTGESVPVYTARRVR